jgi:hypothetical protein
MDTQPHIVYVERLKDSVVIGFDDGKTALYSATLLYATFPQAVELDDPGPDEE